MDASRQGDTTGEIRTATRPAGGPVDRARRGDPRAWEELVVSFSPMVRAVARGYRLCDDDVADAVQQTWLRCLEHLDQLREADRFAGWLVAVCRRECLQRLRQRRSVCVDHTDGTSVLAAAVDPGPDPETVAVEADHARRLRAAIRDLPPRQRDVLGALLRQEDDGYAGMATRLGVPIGSLGPTRARALARLSLDDRLVVA